ncbi:hypothetical protein [Ekhidna sp.]
MKNVSVGLIFLTIIFAIACKPSENFSGSESVSVVKLREVYGKNVSFTLINESSESVQIESTAHFYIEKKEGESWSKVPYIPCQCGTPCRPPAVNELAPQEMTEITWDLISRKCGNENGLTPPIKTVEEKVSSGDYRMTFNVNRQKNGMRIDPEQLVVYFSLK